ncbi:alpha/beta hydrolase [Synechococcus elongatus]|uniref:alpha/beta hydrolase n=1 Tax=Synechococcus elongatus TaxID=32046 RepID=UPI000F7D9EFC|nr:alpha/beta hydrolase [Synechococcus elongatus]
MKTLLLGAFATAAAAALFMPTSAQAANNVTLINGAWARSVTIGDLQAMAKQDQVQGFTLDAVNITHTQFQTVRDFLNRPINYKMVEADYLLNSASGEKLLDQIGMVMAPRTADADGRQALRSAIILSLADDNRTTPLEIIQNYPTDARINLGALFAADAKFIPDALAFLDTNQQLAMQKTSIDWMIAQNPNTLSNRDFAQQEPLPLQESPAPVRGLW